MKMKQIGLGLHIPTAQPLPHPPSPQIHGGGCLLHKRGNYRVETFIRNQVSACLDKFWNECVNHDHEMLLRNAFFHDSVILIHALKNLTYLLLLF